MNNLLIVLKEVDMKVFNLRFPSSNFSLTDHKMKKNNNNNNNLQWKFLASIYQLRCVFGEGDDIVCFLCCYYGCFCAFSFFSLTFILSLPFFFPFTGKNDSPAFSSSNRKISFGHQKVPLNLLSIISVIALLIFAMDAD